MKTNRILTLFSVFTAMLIINTSCVEDDDYGTPNIGVTQIDLSEFGQVTNFSSVIDRYNVAVSDGDQVGVFEADEAALYIEGYVVSSDRASNFFEELIIQNSIDENDPTTPLDIRRGLRIEINASSLSDTYEVGRKVYIKLNGLAIGEENGVYTLGRDVVGSLEQIESYEYQDFIFRGAEVATLTPKITTINALTGADENTLVQFNDVQFRLSDLGTSYAGLPSDNFDGFRTIMSCDETGSIDLQTSTFADFKSVQISQKSGSIKGVFSRDFGDDFNVLVINSTSDINFNNDMRCDPFNPNDFDTVFEEDFTTGFSNGWDVINTEGSMSWNAQDFGGDFYARGSAYNGSNAVQMVSWLISPSFDFDAQDGEQMVLEIADAFSDAGDEPLTAYYSTDYVSGNDPSTATWIEIGANQITALPINTGFFDNVFDGTGLIDLSTVIGNGFIAFVYDSDNAAISSTRDLGNVKILTPQ